MSSNGIGKNPLNDISRIYLQQVAEKKDDSYLEPDMKKRQKNNEKARKDMEKMGTSMKNPHFESLDPVGKEDGDVNNDGKKDSSDSYLMKRRKAIGKAIKGKMMKKESVQQVTEGDGDPCWDSHKQVGMKKKGGKMVPNCVPKTKTESFSAWRNDLSEIMTDDIDSKPIKEKKVVNKIKINPKLGEAIEDIGGSIVEMVEVDEAVYGGEPTASKDTRMTVTAADKKGNTPAYQKYKAGHKGYKSADHMKEDIRDTDPEKGTAERKARLEKKRGMKMDDHPQYKKEEVEVDEAMSSYDRNRKRAAQRAADRNAARAAGKTGVVPGVGYVSPRKEKESYVDSAGTTRHKSGAKMEEVENVEEIYKGKHGQTEKQYQDSRSDAGKMVSGDSKMSGSKYAQGRRTGSDAGPQPAGGSKKPQSQGKMDSGSRTDLTFRKAALKKKAAEMKEDASMTPQELQLQKKKAMIDRMIAQRRQQGLNKAKKSEAPAKAMGEATEDSLRDRRMERGGVDGNNRYKSATKNVAMGGGKKKPYDGMSALEKVKASIRAKHGQGAIKEDAKMAKQSDEKLAALHKQVSGSDQSLPSNQFMMKRVTKEMNRRKKAT